MKNSNYVSAVCLGISTIWGTAMAAPLPDSHAYNLIGVNYALEINFDEGVPIYEQNTDFSTAISVSTAQNFASVVANSSATSITAKSSSIVNDYGYIAEAQGGGSLAYYYRVDGATGAVPIDIAYSMSIAASGSANNYGGESYADLLVYSGADTYEVSLLSLSFSNPNTSQSKNGVLNTIATSEYYNEIILDTDAVTSAVYQGGESTAETFIDPYIYIDPTYLAAHPGVSLEISANVGNVVPSAVPEPATWALMLGGLGLAGNLIRRRKPSCPSACKSR